MTKSELIFTIKKHLQEVDSQLHALSYERLELPKELQRWRYIVADLDDAANLARTRMIELEIKAQDQKEQ